MMAKRTLEGEARDRFIQYLRNKMDEYGITFEDLAAATAAAKAVYRDAKGNEWNGIGDRPDWLQAATNAGASLDFFRISETTPTRDRPEEALFSSSFFRR
ncbi:H-NS family nucleoid-associated regulatory protein [Paraburkholderia youngii]|uniref:H-NS family nucleoid-associated regulatory protein n=1 Tax=Paraburkholderia youngii TaxID=2782701 RepID=UPI003D229610